MDVAAARRQHHLYDEALRQAGFVVRQVQPRDDLADSVFVEDTAVVFDELAVLTRPGAASRRREVDGVREALTPYRALVTIDAPATMDGGDVLVLGKEIYVGLSTRSTQKAVSQLNELLREYGYSVMGVKLHDCLHLKSAVTRVDDITLLINKNWVDPYRFDGFECIEVDSTEPYAANCLPLNGSIIFPTAFPRTGAKLEEKGYEVVTVDVSELAKAEGAVTCCSLIIP